ncbi:MAG: polymer-forming cytoskeletal protein [bacterium]|nr:polymer-forming cytoskeletal protein [bacterium]
MRYIIFIFLVALLLPTSSSARPTSTFSAGRSLLVASSSPGNAYSAGISVVRTANVFGDLSAFGGSVVTAAPVSGDELLIAGSIRSRARVAGDLRAIGGSISVEEPVNGDLIAFGYSVNDSGKVGGSIFIIAANATVSNGASGPVTIYGNNVSLAGDFTGNVNVVASGRVALSASTTIVGKLSYQAPEPAIIHESAVIIGGVEYTNASYLPDAGTSRILSFMSIGFFLFVRILGALILTGLLAGLFPRLAEAVTKRAYTARPSKILLTILLGFAVFVVTPVLFLILALTFVGIGLAILLFISYSFIVLLSLAYAGILLGSLFSRRYMNRETVLWHDGIFGMLALSLIALVPYIGVFVVLLFTMFTSGALLLIFFNFAFPHEENTPELL